jgi:hypothetical protein
MIVPSAADELRCAERTLEDIIKPALKRTADLSALVTVGHILRHVAVRIEMEGKLLHEEIGVLRPLLSDIRVSLARQSANAASLAAAQKIAAALDRGQHDRAGYVGVTELAEDVMALREGISVALRFLTSDEAGKNGENQRLHDSIRRYLGWQVEQEAKMIDPAFVGFGPRR